MHYTVYDAFSILDKAAALLIVKFTYLCCQFLGNQKSNAVVVLYFFGIFIQYRLIAFVVCC